MGYSMKILDSISSDKFEEIWHDLRKELSGKQAFDKANELIRKAGGKEPYSSYKSYQNSYYRRKNENR